MVPSDLIYIPTPSVSTKSDFCHGYHQNTRPNSSSGRLAPGELMFFLRVVKWGVSSSKHLTLYNPEEQAVSIVHKIVLQHFFLWICYVNTCSALPMPIGVCPALGCLCGGHWLAPHLTLTLGIKKNSKTFYCSYVKLFTDTILYTDSVIVTTLSMLNLD